MRSRLLAPVLGCVAALGLVGCGGGDAASEPSVALIRVAAPMHEMVWSEQASAVVGLTDSGSMVESVVPGPTATAARSTLSQPFRDLGRNLAPGRVDQSEVYVPQPDSGQVVVLHVPDLHRMATLQDGPSPSYVARDTGADVLLALSDDGTTVTGVSMRNGSVASSQRVDTSPDADIEGPARERLIEFHVVSPSGVAHYKDKQRVGAIALDAGESAGDQTKVTRLYVAEEGTDRLLAVDSGRSHQGMELVGAARVGAPVAFVGTDDYRVYAVTDGQLVVLRAQSFGGFADGQIPIMETVSFRSTLPAAARSAPVAGLVVGPHRVYVSFVGEPYLLSFAKPDV